MGSWPTMLQFLESVKSLLLLPGKKNADAAASKPLPEAGKERALQYLRQGYIPNQGLPETTGKYADVLNLTVDDITTTNPEPWIPSLEKPSPWLQNIALSLGIQLTLQKDGDLTGSRCLIGRNVAGTKQYFYVAVTSDAALRHLDMETGQLQPTPEFVEYASSMSPEKVVAQFGTHFAKAVRLGTECLQEQSVECNTASGQNRSTAYNEDQTSQPAALGMKETPLYFLSPVTDNPEDWLAVVKNGSHELLDYTVHLPIWKLLPPGDAQVRLQEYISKTEETTEKEERAPLINQTELSFYSLPPKEHQKSAKQKLVYSNESIAARSESTVKEIRIRLSTSSPFRVKAIDFGYKENSDQATTSSSTDIQLKLGDRISHVAGSFREGYLSHVEFTVERVGSRTREKIDSGVKKTDDEVYDYAVPAGSAVVGVRLFDYKTRSWRDVITGAKIARLDLILRSFAEAPGPAVASYDVLICSKKENELATCIAKELEDWGASVLQGMMDPESPHLLLMSGDTSVPLSPTGNVGQSLSHSKGGPYLTEADAELAIMTVGVFIPLVTKELCFERSSADQKAIFMSTRLFNTIETSVVPVVESGVPIAEVENNPYLKKLLRRDPDLHQEAGANLQDFASAVTAKVLDLLGFGDHVIPERLQGRETIGSGTPTSDAEKTTSSSERPEKDPASSQEGTSTELEEALKAASNVRTPDGDGTPTCVLDVHRIESDAGVTPAVDTQKSVSQQPQLEETESPVKDESTRQKRNVCWEEALGESSAKEAKAVPMDWGVEGLDRLLVVDFGSLSELPYSSTKKNASLRRKCLFLQKPYAFLKVPIQLPKPLTNHTLIVRLRTPYLSQTGQIAVGLEDPLGKRHESLQLDTPHKGQVSLVIDNWGVFPFPGVSLEPNSYLFLVLVVDLEAKRVSLYKPSLAGAGGCGQVILENIPPTFKEGIEMVLRSGSKGKTTVKFAAILGRALTEREVLAVRDSPKVLSMLQEDDKAAENRYS